MKKTFLQMIAEIAPAEDAIRDVGKQVIGGPGDEKKIKGEYVTITDPKTGEKKQVYKTEKGERSVAYKATVDGYDKRYRKVIEKFQADPAFKNQVSIIRKNNVFYLNRLYNLIKSQDPSIESLTQLFSKTKNDTEFFSHMNSFIVPLSSVWRISQKIEVGDLWDDENYKKDLENNGFILILPKNQTPTKFNVIVKWGDKETSNKVSLAEFNKTISILLTYQQKFVDVEDKIMIKNSTIKKLLDPIPDMGRIYYNENQILDEIRDTKDFDDLQAFLKVIQYNDESKIPVIGPERLNFQDSIKKIDVQLSKLENERSIINRNFKDYEDEFETYKELSQKIKVLQDKIKENDFIDQVELLKAITLIPEAKIKEAQKSNRPVEVSVTKKVFSHKMPNPRYGLKTAAGEDEKKESEILFSKRKEAMINGNIVPFDIKFKNEIFTLTPNQIELYKFILRALEDVKKGADYNVSTESLKQMIKGKINSHFQKEKEKVQKYIKTLEETGQATPEKLQETNRTIKKLEEIEKTLIQLKAEEEGRLNEYIADSKEYLKSLKVIEDMKQEISSIETRKGGISNFVNKINAVDGQIKSLENKKDTYKNFSTGSSRIVKMLLSNKSINSFEEVFKTQDLLEQISDVYKTLHEIEGIYNSKFTNEVKSIIDSSFIVSDQKRNNFIQNTRKTFKMVKDLEQFALMLKVLKDKINEAKEKEIKLSDKVMDYEQYDENGGVSKKTLTLSGLISKFSQSDMNDLLNRLVGIVISFKSILRTVGFIKLYDGAQYHTQLDVAEMNLDTDTEVDDYFVYVGIVPEDIRSQSTYQFWTSCQTLSGATDLNKYVGTGTLLGNIVCFLLALDWSKPTGGNRMKVVKAPIKHSAITDPDDIISIKEFKDLASEGVKGTKKVDIRKFLRSYAIRPVARVLIKTFELDDMGRGVRTIKPETLTQGGSQEEIETMKYVDRAYTNKANKEAQAMITSKGTARGDTFDKYSTIFYKGIKSLSKRLNINVKVGNYRLREQIYDDGVSQKTFSSAIKKYESGQKVIFSKESTSELLELLKQDKNFLRYRTFRHALFSKDVVDGTLDLQGTEIESLDPMHPTNLPKHGRGLPNDKFEDFDAIEWRVNDNFRKDTGNLEAPLTKEEEAIYKVPMKEADDDFEEYKKENSDLI